MIFVISPAAMVTPPTRNITLPNSLHSLYNSIASGRCTWISIMALVLLPKNRGCFFRTSPVALFSCDMSFEIVAGSTKDWWCSTTWCLHLQLYFDIEKLIRFTYRKTFCYWNSHVKDNNATLELGRDRNRIMWITQNITNGNMLHLYPG